MQRRSSPVAAVALAFTLVACGRDSVTGPTLPSRPTINTALALGAQFACALTADGKPFCWGDGLAGEIGDSSFTVRLVPTAAVGGRTFVMIAAGNQTACAIEQNGTPWCWGDDPAQAGVPQSYRQFPGMINGVHLTSISVGRKFACGLDSSGAAYCWGENNRGQIGVGDTLPRQSPTRVAVNVRFASISLGFWHVCALTSSGDAYCWGDNQYGEAGTGDTLAALTPRLVTGIKLKAVTAGSIHSCGILTSGTASCWGANFSGQLGDGTSTQRSSPTPVAGGLTFTALRSGRANSIFATTCGSTTGGDIYCWGWNSKGQLGASNTVDACIPFSPPGTTNSTIVTNVCSYKPVKATNGISGVVAFDVGQQYVCAFTSGAQLLCWGEGVHGELGDGMGIRQAAPVAVRGGLSFP